MSVHNNAPIAVENPFVDHSGLEGSNVTENEKAILSDCKYAELQKKWDQNLKLISAQPHTHIRNTREVKEGIFRRLGAAMGVVSYEPWKETKQIFSDWRSFDSYVRMDIKSETYQKIAKANPQYFNKVIEHLDKVADDLDKRADVRLNTFVSNQSGQTLSMLANNFRSTAAFLKRMMKGGDGVQSGSNNERSEVDRVQPHIINNYYNNIGHLGDIKIGHIGDNNFHNKNGNVFMQFNGKSNDIRHTGFKSEYSALKSSNSYYSPVINGIELLRLEPGNALKLLEQGDRNKGESFEIQHNEELTFEADKPLPNESEPKKFEKAHIDSMSFEPNTEVSNDKKDPLISKDPTISTKNNDALNEIYEESVVNDQNTVKNLDSVLHKVKTYIKPQHVSQQQSYAPEKAADTNAVKSGKNPLETIFGDLTNLRDKYYRLWDKIHRDKDPKTANTNNNTSFQKRLNIFDKNGNDQVEESDSSFEKLSKLGRQIKELNKTLETLRQNQKIDRYQLSTVSPMLNQIAQVIDNDKQEALKREVSKKTGKSDLAGEQHGLSWNTEVKNKTVSREETNMSSAEARNRLANETQKVIDNIKNQLGITKKKITNHPSQGTTKTVSKSKHRFDVKEISQETNQSSALERRKQFGIKIGERNKNLKKRAAEQGKPPEPSVREKREEYSKNVVAEHNKDMKTDNPLDPKKTWIPNDGSNVQRIADNEHYKNFNSNVTNPLFHSHVS